MGDSPRQVIIRGTKSFADGAMREYTDLEVLQMIGRAGRPQFDTLGVGTSRSGRNVSTTMQRLISGTFQRSS